MEIVTSTTQGIGYPILLQASNGKGLLYVWTIPDNFGDRYRLAPQVLNQIRTVVASDLPERIARPLRIGLFVYDNGPFILENFAAEACVRAVTIGLQVNGQGLATPQVCILRHGVPSPGVRE